MHAGRVRRCAPEAAALASGDPAPGPAPGRAAAARAAAARAGARRRPPRARACGGNVVFMGMGEPLNNYGAVRAALAAMTDVARGALAPGHVCVSTVGVVEKMYALTAECPAVNLALPACTRRVQALRAPLVPAAARRADRPAARRARRPLARAKRRTVTTKGAMVEYILLSGVNDRPEHARRSAAPRQARRDDVLNLIPRNPTIADLLARLRRAERGRRRRVPPPRGRRGRARGRRLLSCACGARWARHLRGRVRPRGRSSRGDARRRGMADT